MLNIVTVDYLLNLLQKISEQGKGNMKVKCLDNCLHKDEIIVDYFDNELRFRGYLFNVPITRNSQKLYSDIQVAIREFYNHSESEESK